MSLDPLKLVLLNEFLGDFLPSSMSKSKCDKLLEFDHQMVQEIFFICVKPQLNRFTILDGQNLVKNLKKETLIDFIKLIKMTNFQVIIMDKERKLKAISIEYFYELNYSSNINLDDHKNFVIKMNMKNCVKDLINWTLMKDHEKPPGRKLYKVQIGLKKCNIEGSRFLNEYRKSLMAKFLAKLSEKSGHSVVDPDHYCLLPEDRPSNEIFIVQSPLDEDEIDRKLAIRLCIGNVENKEDIDTIFENRLEGIRKIGEGRASDPSTLSWSNSLSNLVIASIHLELLSKNPVINIKLDNSVSPKSNHYIQTMYNYARIISILKRYEKGVEDGLFPNLPRVDQVIDNLKEFKKEEIDLIDLLTEWPRVKDSILDFYNMNITLTIFQNFIKQLTHRFRIFYKRNQVIVPGQDQSHLYNQMYWRIYLIKTIKSVYEECFELAHVDYNSSSGSAGIN